MIVLNIELFADISGMLANSLYEKIVQTYVCNGIPKEKTLGKQSGTCVIIFLGHLIILIIAINNLF